MISEEVGEMPEDNSFELEGSGAGPRYIDVYVQHSGDPEQSTGIMIMDGNKIVLMLHSYEIEKLISELASRWKGRKPQGLT